MSEIPSNIFTPKFPPIGSFTQIWKKDVPKAQTMSGTLVKPVLRGHLSKNIIKNVVVASVLASICGVAFKVLYADPKKKKYAEFYKTYDAEAEFRRMRDLGLFQSAKPGEEF